MITKPPPTAAWPPLMQNGQVRDPTVKETLAVAALLDRHFLNHHYEQGWSDEVISTKTGIPRVLVQKIRLESPDHGEIAADPEIARLRQDLQTARTLIGDMETRLARVEQGNQQHGR